MDCRARATFFPFAPTAPPQGYGPAVSPDRSQTPQHTSSALSVDFCQEAVQGPGGGPPHGGCSVGFVRGAVVSNYPVPGGGHCPYNWW